MTVIGEALVVVSPVTTGFSSKIESQVASSGFAGKLEKQFASAGVLSGNSFTQKLTGAFKTAGFGSAGLGLGLALTAGVVVGLSEIGAKFGAAKNQIIKETGATASEVAGLFDTVKRASLGVPASLGDIATAVDLLFKRGVPLGPQLDQLAKQELFLAKITKTDLGTNVEQTTALFAKFNVPLRDQSRELDVLFKASQQSGKGLAALLDPLLAGGAALGQFGFSLDKSTALIANLQKAGVNVQPALAGLRKAFSQIAKEGGDPQKVLASLLAEFTNGTPKTKALADAIKLFGTRAGTELATAIQKGRFDVNALLKLITNGKGGILATGEATLTLGDRFKLLRNRVEESLSGAGLALRGVFSTIVTEASGPVSALVASFVHLGAALAPILAPIGLLLVGTFKAALPIISDLAAGINAIASVVEHLGPVGTVAAVALGVLVFGFDAVAVSAFDAVGAVEAFTVALATNPIFLAVAAVVALGAAIRVFSAQDRVVVKTANDIGNALFDAASKAGIFKEGVASVTSGLREFFAAEASGGKIKGDLKTALTESGTSVTQLASAVTLGSAAWKKFRDDVVNSANASTGAIRPLGRAGNTYMVQTQALTVALDQQRAAFIKSATQELVNVVTSGQLTAAQVKQIESMHRNHDGSIDYASALDDVNTQLSIAASRAQLAADKQNATAQAVSASKIAYRDLAIQIGRSAISEADATTALQALGFTAQGAKDKFKQLQDGVKQFVSAAVGALPSAGSAISDFSSTVTSDTSQLTQDRKTQVDLQGRLGVAIASSAQSVQKQLNAVGLKIIQDQQGIASGTVSTTSTLDSDLRRRTLILQTASVNGGQASASLAAEIKKNNQAIHDDYAKLVADQNPENFAKKLFANAVQILTFTASLRKLVNEGFAPLAGELAKQGPVSAGALAAGLASSPSKAALAAGALSLQQAATDKLTRFATDLGATGAAAGTAAGTSLTKAAISAVSDPVVTSDLRRFGLDAGIAYHEGLAAGIALGRKAVTQAADQLAKDVLATQKGRFRSSSPSKAAMEIGGFYGQGLALGISSSAGLVRSAAATLAAQTISETGGLGVNIASSIRAGVLGGLPTKADLAPFNAASTQSLADFVSFASGVFDNLHKTVAVTTVDIGQVQNILDNLTREGTTQAATFGQTLVDRLLAAKLLIPHVAPTQPSSQELNAAIAQSLPVASPQERADAQRQQDAAQAARGRGLFDGAIIQFPEKADPTHIAAVLAWKLLT